MPIARRSRTIAAPADELWAVICDPHHLPRWWPRVIRVEDVRNGAFTEVMKTKKGNTVRADFELVEVDPEQLSVCWQQRLTGTPFAAVLEASETAVRLEPRAGIENPAAPTEVTIELRQQMSGGRPLTRAPGARQLGRFSLSWGERIVRKAALATIGEALAGLERISV